MVWTFLMPVTILGNSSLVNVFLFVIALLPTHQSCAVYADGGICLDILQNQWSPIYDVAAILTSIQAASHFLRSLIFLFHNTSTAAYKNCRQDLMCF